MRSLRILFAIVACTSLASLTYSFAVSADPPKSTLKHMVMYKFRDDLTPAQVQEVIDAFTAMTKKIPSVTGFEHGVNSSKEGKSEGLTHCFVVSFRDEEGLAEYLKHPAHDEYVLLARTRREKVIVFDYTTK